MNNFIRVSGDFLLLNIKVIPGASKSAIGELSEGRLKIRVAAAPEGGKANEELCSFLAKSLRLIKKDVTLVSGEKSRLKTLRLPVSAKDSITGIINHDR